MASRPKSAMHILPVSIRRQWLWCTTKWDGVVLVVRDRVYLSMVRCHLTLSYGWGRLGFLGRVRGQTETKHGVECIRDVSCVHVFSIVSLSIWIHRWVHGTHSSLDLVPARRMQLIWYINCLRCVSEMHCSATLAWGKCSSKTLGELIRVCKCNHNSTYWY